MTLFFITAALLVVIVLLWLLLGLFRANTSDTDQEAVNITLARERRTTLDEALANNAIDQTTYDYEREQLALDLASDLHLENERAKKRSGGQIGAAILVAVFVPVAAGALYLQLGNPGAITQNRAMTQADTSTTTDAQNPNQLPALTDLLPRLEERLAASPDDVKGWRLLGRTYSSVSDFPNAQKAFEKALALDENDVPTLALLAESIAMVQNGDLAGEPMAYLERANTLEPQHEHSLWLLSIAHQQANNHEAALVGFDQLVSMAGNNAEAQATIEQMRSQSVQALAGGVAGAAPQTSAPVSKPSQPSNTNSVSIDVTVTLGEPATGDPDDTVYIYAKASQGPPMPLAVSRLSVKDLPATITLDDSMAMIPSMTLSAFPDVTIGARISPSGKPVAQPGDWFTEQTDIIVNDTDAISLTIDTQTP